MVRDEIPLPGERLTCPVPNSDTHLLAELRGGDVAAGRRFVREYYPAIYRYLLYLTGHRETAEDLTQETFVQAWRHLDQFQGRAPFRVWLHTIARHEFLRARRGQRDVTALEAGAELAEPHSDAWTEEAELRVLLGKLPEEQQEVMLLSCLAGYSSGEIAQILQVPARTVRHRLALARAHLAQALGPGDLAYLNEPSIPMRQWAWLPLDQMQALEARLGMGGKATEAVMERREFLRQAAAGAAGLMLPEAEKEIVDSRLAQKVTLAFKGTALSDLCDHLRAQTGVHLAAGASVADEKVALFCKQMALRDVMRQFSRPFGYAWVRSMRNGQYRYELMQDMRSQLLEEELRNRDRNAALLALEREIQRYRPYLDLTPNEALERSKSSLPVEKTLLEKLAGCGWGPIHMYFRLSRQQQEALRAGQELTFSQEPQPDEQPLPADLAHGIFESFHDGSPASSDLRARLTVSIHQSELGQFTLRGISTIFDTGRSANSRGDAYAVGRSPGALKPDNRAANGRLAGDPGLRARVTVHPRPSCVNPSPFREGEQLPLSASGDRSRRRRGSRVLAAERTAAGAGPRATPGAGAGINAGGVGPGPKVTTADVLEALYLATGMPIVADDYTRLYPPASVSVKGLSLFDALNQLADSMRLRWTRDGAWLQFRSASFYDDRLKEVPNRLLARWAASRRRHGALTLDDLVEIAQLSDAQLDAEEMAEGAREYLGLTEWDLARSRSARAHLRFLGTFSPAQRREVTSAAGLPFTRLALAQQQQYLALGPAEAVREGADGADQIQGLEELAMATLRVDYTLPGWFQWGAPADPEGRPRPIIGPWPVRESTPATALRAARHLDPEVTEAQLVHTDLEVIFIYLWSAAKRRYMRRVNQGGSHCIGGW